MHTNIWQQLDNGEYARDLTRFDPIAQNYAADLQLAIQAAAQTNTTLEQQIANIPRLLRYCLLRARLASQTDSYPLNIYQSLLQQGQFEQVQTLLHQLSDPKQQISNYFHLAAQLEEPQAEQFRQQARKLWQQFNDWQRYTFLEEQLSIELEHYSDSILHLIPCLLEPTHSANPLLQAKSYQLLADYYLVCEPQTDTSEQARQALLSLDTTAIPAIQRQAIVALQNTVLKSYSQAHQQTPAYTPPQCYPNIVALMRQGQTAQAWQLLQHEEPLLWQQLAIELAQAGLISQAQQLLLLDHTQFNREHKRHQLSDLLAKAGRIEQAQTLIERLSDSDCQSLAELTLAQALMTQGHFEQAQVYATRFQGRQKRKFLANTCKWQIDQGQTTTAIQLLKTIEDQDLLDASLGELFEQLNRNGQAEQVLSIAAQLSSDNELVRCAIAEALCLSGQFEQARPIIAQLDYLQFDAQRTLVMALAQHNQLDQALDLVKQNGHDRLYGSVVEGLIKAGRLADALSYAYFDPDDYSYRLLAQAFAQAQDLPQALALIDQIPNQIEREDLLSEIIEILAQQGDFAQAQRLTQQIQRIFAQSNAYQAIAQQLIAHGHVAAAVQLLQQICLNTHEYDRLDSHFKAFLPLIAQFPDLAIEFEQDLDWLPRFFGPPQRIFE